MHTWIPSLPLLGDAIFFLTNEQRIDISAMPHGWEVGGASRTYFLEGGVMHVCLLRIYFMSDFCRTQTMDFGIMLKRFFTFFFEGIEFFWCSSRTPFGTRPVFFSSEFLQGYNLYFYLKTISKCWGWGDVYLWSYPLLFFI